MVEVLPGATVVGAACGNVGCSTGLRVLAGAGAVITGPAAQEVAPIKIRDVRKVTNIGSAFFISSSSSLVDDGCADDRIPP